MQQIVAIFKLAVGNKKIYHDQQALAGMYGNNQTIEKDIFSAD
jgi:hypothetical protein